MLSVFSIFSPLLFTAIHAQNFRCQDIFSIHSQQSSQPSIHQVSVIKNLIEPLIELGHFDAVRTLVHLAKEKDAFDRDIDPYYIQILINHKHYDLALREIDWFFSQPFLKISEISLTAMKAKVYFLKGNIPESISIYRKVLQLDPNNIIAHTQMGRVLLLSGQPREALIYLKHAQKIEPRNKIVFRNRLMAYQALRDIPALEAIVPQLGGLARPYNEAALEVMKGHYTKALELLKNSPQTVSFLRLRAQVYYSMGRMDQAYKDLILVVQNSKAVDLFAVSALFRIEKMDIADKDFIPSPLLSALINQLSDGEFQVFLKIRNNEPWLFEADLYSAPEGSDITNSFWSQRGLYSTPVNSQAVQELKKVKD